MDKYSADIISLTNLVFLQVMVKLIFQKNQSNTLGIILNLLLVSSNHNLIHMQAEIHWAIPN